MHSSGSGPGESGFDIHTVSRGMVVVLENGDTGIDSGVAAAIRVSRIVQRRFATRYTDGQDRQGNGRRKESREHGQFSGQPRGAVKSHRENSPVACCTFFRGSDLNLSENVF